MNKIKFYDENTRQWWTPNTGGANIPSINDLLAPWGISFSDEVLEGEVYIAATDGTLHYASGAGIHSFPTNGFVVPANSLNDQGKCCSSLLLRHHPVSLCHHPVSLCHHPVLSPSYVIMSPPCVIMSPPCIINNLPIYYIAQNGGR